MKKTNYITTAVFLLSLSPLYSMAERLWESFLYPSPEARTKVWCFHGETETTKEGIDADLKAFKNAGIGGVVFYDQTHGAQEGACPSLSPEWWEMLKYAALKAKELGLSFDMAATNGYAAGGPWITPENGMKKIGGSLKKRIPFQIILLLFKFVNKSKQLHYLLKCFFSKRYLHSVSFLFNFVCSQT